MNRVPPEIDGLMWAVADNPTQQAIEEFASRYPAHRGELMRRVNMVRGLRNEIQPGTQLRNDRPVFQLREAPAPPRTRTIVITAFLGAAAVAAACFTVMSAQPKPTPPPVAVVRTDPPKQPAVVYETPNSSPPPPREEAPTPPPLKDETTPEPAYLVPKPEVKLANIGLVDALTLITSGTGLHLIIGPGFVDQKISLEYHGKNTVEMLNDLSRQYAFTIRDEGNGDFLAIPVPDPDPADAPTGVKATKSVHL